MCTPTFRFSELFSAPLSQTLAKLHDGVSLLTKLPELKFDHRFGCPVDIQACTPNFALFRAIWTRFKPNSSKKCTTKFHFWQFSRNWNLIIDLDAHFIDMHALQLSWRFELFSPPLTPTFVKPHNEVSIFTNFVRIKIWSSLLMHIWMISVHANFHDVHSYFQLF